MFRHLLRSHAAVVVVLVALAACSSANRSTSTPTPASSSPATSMTVATPPTTPPAAAISTSDSEPQPTTSTTTTATTPTTTSSVDGSTTIPQSSDFHPDRAVVRAAFYYPWFPETWDAPAGGTFTNFHPASGRYDSSNLDTIQRHVDEMTYAHIDVAISSWFGPTTRTGERFGQLLAATVTTPGITPNVQWAIYYEPEGTADPSAADIVADLTGVVNRYASDQRIFRVDGRFVVFVYGDPDDGCEMADRWHDVAAALPVYVVLKVFDGYRSCASQPDAWHQYAPANRTDSQPPFSFSVSPGFWLSGEGSRLDRDPDSFRQAVTEMVASQAHFQLVTTFNEWGEGTAVEPADEWSSESGYGTYLDILHDIPTQP